MKKTYKRPYKKLVITAAVIVLILGLCMTAYATDLFGLKDLLLPNKLEVKLPIDPVEDDQELTDNEKPERETQMVDAISLAGYMDTAESRATAEWRAFLNGYDTDGKILDSMGNDIFAPGTSYMHYNVYSQEMADRLDEITAQYGLKLHTDLIFVSQEELIDKVGGDFLGENRAYSAYMYEDGTFKFDGEIDLAGYGNLDYQFQRCVRGSFTDIQLNIGDVNDYTEWHYTAACGTPVTLALAPHKALIIADLPDSFVTLNILAGTETAEDNIFSSGPLTAEDLERFADTFDFSPLSLAKPVDTGDIPKLSPEQAEAAWETDNLLYLNGIDPEAAQKFYAEFVAAIEEGDRAKAAEMLYYPVYVTTESGAFGVASADAFSAYYDLIITDGLRENIAINQFNRERADLIVDNGMVGAAGGCIWFMETENGGFRIMTVQNPEGRSVRHGELTSLTETTYDGMYDAYATILDRLLNGHMLPDSTVIDTVEDMEYNHFALADVNGGGNEELIILYTNTYTSAQTGMVVEYNEYSRLISIVLTEFPMLTFYDNGYVKAGWSHSQGVAGDALWPYTLYYYEPEAGKYLPVAMVDAWSRELAETYHGEAYPEHADTSGSGAVYYIYEPSSAEPSEPMDITEYEAWLESYLGGAKEITPEYMSLTEENIRSIE